MATGRSSPVPVPDAGIEKRGTRAGFGLVLGREAGLSITRVPSGSNSEPAPPTTSRRLTPACFTGPMTALAGSVAKCAALITTS
jgi:hypothetical protein